MKYEVTILLAIDDALRFALYGVSIVLDIDLRASEIERMFEARASGNISPQEYEFHRSPHVLVVGRVEEHEPETVWLSVEARKFDQALLVRLVEGAKQASSAMATNRRETSPVK